MNGLRVLSIVTALLLARVAVAQDIVKLPDEIGEKTTCLNPEFLLYRPKGVDASKKAPLLVYLHGIVWRGRNIESLKRVGGWGLFANAEKHKLLLVMPQCDIDVKGGKKGHGRWNPDDLNLLVEYLKENYRIDQNCIYLAGYSMGGFGTWSLASEYPERFAAIAPICGGGNRIMALRLSDIPIWVFHGAKDKVVPLEESEEMVNAIRNRGGNVKFTVYPDAGHDSWTETYNNQQLYDWFLEYRKSNKTK